MSLGTVVASSDEDDPLLSKRVFLVPARGWDSDPHGPESKYRECFLLPLASTDRSVAQV